MAQIFGTSKNWKLVLFQLKTQDLSANSAEEIRVLHDKLIEKYELSLIDSLQKTEKNISEINTKIHQEKLLRDEKLKDLALEYSNNIEQLESKLGKNKRDRKIYNIIRNHFRNRRDKRKLDQLINEFSERRVTLGKADLARELELDILVQKKNEIARESCKIIKEQIDFLDILIGSNEFSGSIAEFEMIKHLGSDPNILYIFNNLIAKTNLESNFLGSGSKENKIDHLVVTKAGLFAIFIQRPGEFLIKTESILPIIQYLVDRIKGDLPEITIRSIGTFIGKSPEEMTSTFVKVLPIHEIAGYIDWFQEDLLSENNLSSLIERIQSIFLLDINSTDPNKPIISTQ